MKTRLGHDGPPIGGYWTENLVTEEPLQRCPLRTLQLAPPALGLELARHTETYYPAYVAGQLLNDGGLAAQPARYLDLMTEIATYAHRAQAKHDDLRARSGGEED